MRFDIIYNINIWLLIKGSGVTFCSIPSHCGLTFDDCADRAAKRGAIDSIQSTVYSQQYEMFRCLQRRLQHYRKQLGFCRSVSHYPVLNNVTRSLSSLVYVIKTNISKDVICICKEKRPVNHILLSAHKVLFAS